MTTTHVRTTDTPQTREGPKPVGRLLVFGALDPSAAHRARMADHGVDWVALADDADPADVRAEIARCDAIIFNNVDINPYLDAIGTDRLGVLAATGYSFIDVARAQALGVRLARLTDYSVAAVADYMLAAAFGALRPLAAGAERVRANRWDKAGLFGRELSRQRAGVIGCGKVGRELVGRLRALGVQTGYTTRSSTATVPGATRQSLDDLLHTSDLIFVCCDANPTSTGLLGHDRLARLRQNAVLVSISPNSVIDPTVLADALARRADVQAVMDLDPIEPGHRLLTLPNATVTPHIAFATDETVERRFDECLDVVFSAANGEPVAWISGGTPTSSPVTSGSERVAARDRLLAMASSFYDACTLNALVTSGVLSVLDRRPRLAAEIADEFGLDRGALVLLLAAARTLGLLATTPDGAYALAPDFAELLSPSSAFYAGPMAESVMASSYEPWAKLGDLVRTGAPARINQQLREDSIDWARRLTHGSHSLSAPLAGALADCVQGPVSRILDIGCGPATLTRELLRRFPAARATLIDRPLPLAVLREDFIEPENLSDRCRLVDRDMADPAAFEPGQDLVVTTNVVHMLPPAEAAALVRRAADALAPGGQLLLTSFLTEDGDADDPFTRQFALSCRLLSPSARGYGRAEVAHWIAAAGLTLERAGRIGALTTVLRARRPGERA